MRKILTVLAALTLVASFSTASWAITFSQDAGFDTTNGNLLSDDDGIVNDNGLPNPDEDNVTTNDIRWSQDVVAVPGDLPGDYSVVTPTSPYFNTITWGVANNSGGLDPNATNWGNINYSGLRVIGFTGDATIGEWTTISRVFHQNNTIDSDLVTLQSAIIRSALTVGTTDVDLVPFSFEETLNASNPCPGGFGNPCPDEFTFDASIFTPVFFTADGKTYKAEFQFANLFGATLDFSGAPLLRLWTNEGVVSHLDVQFRLTQVVPEPASMMLLGSGLLGMLGIRRKKVSA